MKIKWGHVTLNTPPSPKQQRQSLKTILYVVGCISKCFERPLMLICACLQCSLCCNVHNAQISSLMCRVILNIHSCAATFRLPLASFPGNERTLRMCAICRKAEAVLMLFSYILLRGHYIFALWFLLLSSFFYLFFLA